MKPLLVVCVALVALVAAADEWKPVSREESFKIHTDCGNETGVTEERSRRILKKEFTDDKNVHEHVMCVFKKLGVFTEDEGYNADRLVAQFTSSHLNGKTARDIVTKCVNSNGEESTPALRAYRGLECLVTNRLYELMQEDFDKATENKGMNEI